MVAFDSTYSSPLDSTIDFAPRKSSDGGRGSHGAGRRARQPSATVQRDSLGQIDEVRIGAWRVLGANDLRRIAEVRELSAGRTAVLIERRAAPHGPVTSVLWQLYNATGRLTAAIHTNPDHSAALMMNYQTREAQRLAAGDDGELHPVAQWRF